MWIYCDMVSATIYLGYRQPQSRQYRFQECQGFTGAKSRKGRAGARRNLRVVGEQPVLEVRCRRPLQEPRRLVHLRLRPARPAAARLLQAVWRVLVRVGSSGNGHGPGGRCGSCRWWRQMGWPARTCARARIRSVGACSARSLCNGALPPSLSLPFCPP